MKIIKSGRKKMKATYQGECIECGCVVECDPSEIRIDAKGGAPYVFCPECGNQNLKLVQKLVGAKNGWKTILDDGEMIVQEPI